MKQAVRTTSAFSSVLIFCTCALAQTMLPGVDIGGVTLKLGMARNKCLQQMKSAGYNFFEQAPKDESAIVILTRADVGAPEQRPESLTLKQMVKRATALAENDGVLTFRAGLLIGIQTEISSNIQTDRELAASLYALFRHYETDRSSELCALGTEEDSISPHVDQKQIVIKCALSGGSFRRTTVLWTTNDLSVDQLHVRIFQDLY
jgi:hypothetical protein